MADAEESTDCSINVAADVRRARAPSKKRFDEEMEALNISIRRTEEQLEALKTSGPGSFAEAFKSLKAEKNANIERRKKIDADLQKLNKDTTEMMHNISRLESTLHYRSEDKIDTAIKRLEWSLTVQNFKLSQEKKIVAEIDSLRRSKKTLIQYLSMKKEKDAMRDRQRRMREERDYYFHKVTELKQREEKLRSENTGKRVKSEQLKKELDRLYEARRQMVAQYKKQRGNFFDDREKRRHEIFKKHAEEKQALQVALSLEREEHEARKPPSEDHICLCNTLIQYLQRFISGTDLEVSSPGVTVTPPPALPFSSPSEESAAPLPSGPAEELEDGQYVLLRKPEDDSYVSCSAKHAARKQRRSRKQSVVRRITHTPEVLSQFLLLTLNPPTTVAEILASLEQLRARKLYYEREAEVRSEAELSITESGQCEVSRQASYTESIDDLGDSSQPSDHLMEQLLLLSSADHCMGSSISDYDAPTTTTRSGFDITASTTANAANEDENLAAKGAHRPCSDDYVSSVAPHDADSHHSGLRSEGSDSTRRGSYPEGCGGDDDDAEEGEKGGVVRFLCEEDAAALVAGADGRSVCPKNASVAVNDGQSVCPKNASVAVDDGQSVCPKNASVVGKDSRSVCDASVPGPDPNQDPSSGTIAASVAMKAGAPSSGCGGGSDVFYAKKAEPGPGLAAAASPSSSSSPPEICSGMATKASVIDSSDTVTRPPNLGDGGGSNGGGVKRHICEEVKAKEAAILYVPSRAQDCDRSSGTSPTAENTNVSSLEDFPVLARERPCKLGVGVRISGGEGGGDLLSREVFHLQGKQTGLTESTRL